MAFNEISEETDVVEHTPHYVFIEDTYVYAPASECLITDVVGGMGDGGDEGGMFTVQESLLGTPRSIQKSSEMYTNRYKTIISHYTSSYIPYIT